MTRDALVVGINQYPCLKDSPTSKASKAKHLKTSAADAEAIAFTALPVSKLLWFTYRDYRVEGLN